MKRLLSIFAVLMLASTWILSCDFGTGGADVTDQEVYESTCGDNQCDSDESCSSCPGDCGACSVGAVCGDGECDNTESCSSCPRDCGNCNQGPICGDGTCNGTETCNTCSQDCACAPFCGDGHCDDDESCTVEGLEEAGDCVADCGYCDQPDCDCDYNEDVCEPEEKNSTVACYCDPDCEFLDPCDADDHCDTWCPAGTDPDCGSSEGYCGDGTCDDGEYCVVVDLPEDDDCLDDCGYCDE